MEFTRPLESSTRKKIDTWLANLGWNNDEESSDCNVITERGLTQTQKKKLAGKQPDYLLLRSGTSEPIGIIEAKAIGENLEDALQSAIKKYAIPLDVPIVFATDGTFIKSWHMLDRQELSINDDPIKELISEKTLIKFIDQGHNIEAVSELVKHSRDELIKIFEWANNLLRKEGLRGLDRFVEFANLLFLKLITEIEEEKERAGEPRILEKRYCWDAFSDLPAETMMGYLNDTVLPHLVERYNHTGDIFQSRMQISSPYNLKAIVDKLSDLTLINTESEIKGDAFEYFLKRLATGNDLGEYFTPRHLVRVMTKIINPQYGERIYDPCCGTGGFLIEAFRHIKASCKITSETMDKLKNDTVFGVELTNTARIAKMNMILAGDGHTNIQQSDALANRTDGYDVVITNFPFSQHTDYGYLYGLATEDANLVFIKHIVDSLVDGGRAAIIVFQGILYDSSHLYKNVRQWLLENCDVEAVIKLHNYLFQPYTGVNTSIIVFRKGRPTGKVWFFNVENDGYEKTTSLKGRSKIAENDLDLLEAIWTTKEETDKSWFATIDEIRKNNYSLNIESYKPLIPISTDHEYVMLNDETYFEFEKGREVGSDTYCGNEKGIPFIRVGDLTGKGSSSVNTTSSNYVEVTEDDVLLSLDGTPGVARTGFNGAISAGIRRIRSRQNNEILNEFIFYALMSEDVQQTIKRYTKESTIAHAGEAFEYIRIPKPTIEFQKEFIRKIKEQNEKIEKISALLSAYRSAIDDSLFEFGDDNYREIKLADIITSGPQNGLYKHKSFYGSGTPIIRIDNIYDGQLFASNIKRVRLDYSELNRYCLNNGDIVLNRVNSEEYIGKCCIYNGDFPECVFESNMMRFAVNADVVLPEYVVYYLTSSYGNAKIRSKMKRAVNQVSVNQSDVKSILIPVPNKTKQIEIVRILNQQINLIQQLQLTQERLEKDINNKINSLYRMK